MYSSPSRFLALLRRDFTVPSTAPRLIKNHRRDVLGSIRRASELQAVPEYMVAMPVKDGTKGIPVPGDGALPQQLISSLPVSAHTP